jgi:multiple sugar transport system permease protein
MANNKKKKPEVSKAAPKKPETQKSQADTKVTSNSGEVKESVKKTATADEKPANNQEVKKTQVETKPEAKKTQAEAKPETKNVQAEAKPEVKKTETKSETKEEATAEVVSRPQEAEAIAYKPKRTTWERNQLIWGWIFIAPTMLGIIILNLWPIIQTVYQSFCKTGDFGKGNVFVGFDNYVQMFHDSEVWQSLLNTLKYAVIEVPFSIAIALVLAVFLNRKMHGRTVYRAIFFLPMIAAPAAVAMVWRWLYNSQFGLLNHIFGTNIEWISNPKIAWISIAVIGVWSVIGYNMVLFLAGLQEIPKDYYEAADIDGASGVRAFFSITMPLLSPTIFFVLITRIIGAFQVFDLVYMVMDKTNPALPKTQSIVYLFYQYAFDQGNKGYGAAIVMLLIVVIMIITVIQMIGQKKWVHYN